MQGSSQRFGEAPSRRKDAQPMAGLNALLCIVSRNNSASRFLANATTKKTALPGPLSAAVSVTPETAAAAAMFGARTSLVYGKRTAFEILAVKCGDRGLSFGIRRHFDKSETSGPSGKFVLDDRYRSDLSMGFKKLPNVTFAGVERQITNIDVHVRHPSGNC